MTMPTDQDHSFVQQSLSDTLNASIPQPPRTVPKPAASKTRRLINPKEMALRKAKADEESGGILKSLGLAQSPRKTFKASDKEAVTDWEQVDKHEGSENSSSNQLASSDPSNHLAQSSSDPPINSPTSKRNESTMLDTLRRQLSDSEKTREELSLKCSRLERELNEIKDNNAKTDAKVLEVSQYQELERQFDEQEKLLSGYQRENERSLIELEATKVKMLKMGNLLSKVYGPDWEDAISSMNDGSPSGTLRQNSKPNRLNNSSPSMPNTITIPNTPSEKLSLQLAQVQLLVQGMERKLVSREVELENLHKQTREEHLMLQESINRIGSKPPSRKVS